MLQQEVTQLARRLIKGELGKSREQLQHDTRLILAEAAQSGLASSGVTLGRIRTRCVQEVETRGNIVWEGLRKAMEAAGVTYSEELASDLKREAAQYFDISPLTELLREEASKMGLEKTAAAKGIIEDNVLPRARDQALESVENQIDLYVVSLSQRAEKKENNILLMPEQEELLCHLVEATQKFPGGQRQAFIATNEQRLDQLTTLLHAGLPGGSQGVFMGDMKALLNVGLLVEVDDRSRTPFFAITPLGFKHYGVLKQRIESPVQRVETEIRRYLDGDRFHSAYSTAYQKWTEAEALLWNTEAQNRLTTIGHLCREAMQEFASALVERYQPSNIDPHKAHTKNRLRSVLELKASQLGTTEQPFLAALIAYQDTLDDLIQRQEHGGQREREPLAWADGRRCVFHTALVMLEIDSALSRTK